MSTITMVASAPIRLPLSAPQIQQDGQSEYAVHLALVRGLTKSMLSTVTILGDSSAGVAQALNALVMPAIAIGAAATGSNLADPTTTTAALVTVVNATSELFTKVLAASVKLGLPLITYSGGGTTSGTIPAITKVVNGASAGVAVATYDALLLTLNTAHYTLATMIDRLAVAAGTPILTGVVGIRATWSDTPATTIAAFNTTLGSGVSPGVLVTEAQADLTQIANNVATMAYVLNAAITGYTVVPVVVVAG